MRGAFADADGRLRATFEIVWLSGWAPHESQQKPLKPGSAAQRLADALGTKEISTGEKAGAPAIRTRRNRQTAGDTSCSPTRHRRKAATSTPAMPAAMMAYSIAVAPSCADRKRRASRHFGRMKRRMVLSCSGIVVLRLNSAIRCDTSGTSAGGIWYSRSRFGLTQASFCPSSAVTVPSQRRQTYSGIRR